MNNFSCVLAVNCHCKEKTCYTVFSSSKTKCCVSLKLNGDDLEQVNTCRYLMGVIVDNELKWISHNTSCIPETKQSCWNNVIS